MTVTMQVWDRLLNAIIIIIIIIIIDMNIFHVLVIFFVKVSATI